MACKDKNYTRHHCRVKNSHLQMPWATSYVVLSAIPSDNGSCNGNESIQTADTSENVEIGSKRSRSDSQAEEASVKKSKSDDSSISTKDNANDDNSSTDVVEKRETFSDYKGCKAFLLTIGKGDCVLSVSRFALRTRFWLIQIVFGNRYSLIFNHLPYSGSKSIQPHLHQLNMMVVEHLG